MLEDENRVEHLQISGSGMQVQVDDEESKDGGLSGFEISQRASLESAGISYAAHSRSVNKDEHNNSVSPSQIDDMFSYKSSSLLSRSALFAMKRDQGEQQRRKNTTTDDFDDMSMDDSKNDASTNERK